MARAECIVLVRHGETVGESSIRYYGATDVALSDLGRSQMRATASQLADRHFDLVVTSPLSRARESAAIVAPGASPIVDERLREVDFGEWEGMTREEIALRDPELHGAWNARAPGFEYPGGERGAAFRARVAGCADALAARGDFRAALVVVHKGVIRRFVSHLAGEEAWLEMAPEAPRLGGVVELVRLAAGGWEVSHVG